MNEATTMSWEALAAEVAAILAEVTAPEQFADAGAALREGLIEGMAQAEADAANPTPNH